MRPSVGSTGVLGVAITSEPDCDSALGDVVDVALRDGENRLEVEPVLFNAGVRLTGVIERSTSSSTFETGGDARCAG